MTFQFTEEKTMEERLIQQLTEGVSQWTYREDLTSEEKLWENFKKILESNNLQVLDGVKLTDQEFLQIKNQLNFSSFYEAAKWLAGENGIAKVQVQREDAKLGTIRLNVINRADIAGGTSVYEVINQFSSKVLEKTGQKRRFDISLLINGLPLIHIELKSRRTDYLEAFHQIKKYLREDRFTGVYSAVQMFVISNGSETRYIAPASDTKLNPTFLTRWVDAENEPVDHYLDFASHVLSIPEAHQMVTEYTVLDSDSRSLIILRPYQIHAINAVRSAMKERKSGYIWHTTGSGKTLTSYKVAKNLLTIPSLDKTIFIVDRIDLDQQTTSSFTSYAENDTMIVDETDSVSELTKKLLSKDRTVTITTIQKLNHLLKRAKSEPDKRDYKKLRDLNLAFIVDECHRAVSPLKQLEINRFFPNALWYGFTGTPIFAENAKKSPGDLPKTTEEQYGEKLHVYTVKEAIHDKAVLGFQVEYLSTIPEDDVDDIILANDPTADIYNMSSGMKESEISYDYYYEDDHMLSVIDKIVNHSRSKFRLQSGSGRTYSAILTTSSIHKAQRYYKLFKKVIEGQSEVEISPKVKELVHDFPKVAITYSLSENEERSERDRQAMVEAISDYNEMFGTSFDLSTEKAYNLDLNKRIARKSDLYLRRSEQLDLVIVVDRLLTGFDAPCLSILFMDRPPMTPHSLIQAFSRTNRLFDRDKRFGQILTFQTPVKFQKEVETALVLYSNGGENYVLAPSWQKAQEEFKNAVLDLRETAEIPEATTDLTSLEEKVKFLKVFQDFDRAFADIQVYSEFELESLEEDFLISVEEIEDYYGRYENIREEIKPPPPPIDPEGEDGEPLPIPVLIDIDYEIRSLKKQEIDYQYIVMLIQTYVPKKEETKEEILFRRKEEEIQNIYENIEKLEETRPEIGQIVKDVFEDLLENPEIYAEKSISSIIEKRIRRETSEKIKSFSKNWKLDVKDLDFVIDHYTSSEEANPTGERELLNNADLGSYNEANEKKLNKIQFNKKLRKAYREFIESEILPYMTR